VGGEGGGVVAHSQCGRAKCLLVGVPVVLGNGLGPVFAFLMVHMGAVVAVGDRGGGRGRLFSPLWPLRMVATNQTTLLNVVTERL